MSDLQKMDLSGVFYIQQQYLTDLSAISGNNIPVAQYLTPLQKQLDQVYNSFEKANTSSSYVLDHQKEMNTIIQNESDRLNQKKTGVDDALYSQRRLVDLNESYRKKNLQYIKILMVIICTLLIYLALVILRRSFPFIPSLLINVLIAANFSIALILIIVIVSSISKRDELDYDKLKLSSPTTSDSSGTSTSTDSTTTTSSSGTCTGEACCEKTDMWDGTKCVDNFTLISEVYGNNHLANDRTFQPYIPSEFDSYATY